MRTFGWLLLTAVCGSVVVFGAIAWLTAGETLEAHYSTYAEAERESAVERGWIPPFVPHTATAIADVHNLDTNAQVLRFEAPAEDLGEMASLLAEVEAEDMAGIPSHVREDENPASFYRAAWPERRQLCIAIVWAREQATMWTCRGAR